jgi:glycosyltransferase involved in cell wall biosynthesis
MSQLLTVFLGVHNGSTYLDSLKNQLKNQSVKDFKLVIVDNCSQDSSWEKLQGWKEEFGEALTLHRNEHNLGGGGSLEQALRIGLISTPWFALMHQDDFYLSNHIEVLTDTIQGASPNIVGVCTAMGSMGNDGSTQPSPPRAMWLIEDSSQVNSFLVNLRVQAFSFPTAAVKTDSFTKSFAHWHSPSFSDTETTLNLITLGDLKYVKKETIKYRENPNSESHVVNSFESTIGASLGLTRVFTSKGFRDLLKKVEVDLRAKFFAELISGIENRLTESSMAHHLKILAAEECCYAWDYSELESNSFLATTYVTLGSNFTSSLLAEKSAISSPPVDLTLETALRRYSNQLENASFGRSTIKSKRSPLLRLTSMLPLPARISLFKVYVRIRAIKQPDFYWNIFWK